MIPGIEDYGIVGNMHTAALVGRNGSVDWLCLPHFDSPSVFGAILDEKKGGHFSIHPQHDRVTYKQLYWPETNVLITRFHCEGGAAEIVDFMPVRVSKATDSNSQMVRTVTVLSGQVGFEVVCEPAFNYGRDDHDMEVTPRGACFHSPTLSMGLATEVKLKRQGKSVTGRFVLGEGQAAVFVLSAIEQGAGCSLPFSEKQAQQAFKETVQFWRRWLSKCTYTGRWREMVHRSALLLKLLTFEPTGAIVAAPTCSLPEAIGGGRNWDYRYVWIRDAAFTVYALMRIGFAEEAARFMEWIYARCQDVEPNGSLQQVYGLNGQREIDEHILKHLDGYKGSRPVRTGNAAYGQLQLDIYGELMDSVYLYNKYGSPISYDLWEQLCRIMGWVCNNWRRPDEGIWEFRSGPRHNVYSKLMCWVALDRGLRLAEKRSFPSDVNTWRRNRDEIYKEIMKKGWSEKRGAFVQAYDSEALDAANLIMPLVFFMSPTDPRMIKTIDATNRSPKQGGLVSNGLVYRYNPAESTDGLEGEEGTFNICSFWLIEALTRAGRVHRARLDEARLLFEKMLGYANHLGLFSEQIGKRGEALGNFPQAFTHIALISAAYNLDRSLGT
jgi:GH15 family glucan-1,4-alpha-glucosidase